MREYKTLPPFKNCIYILAVLMFIFQIVSLYAPISPMIQRAVFLVFVLVIVFLLFPAKKSTDHGLPQFIDYIFVALSLLAIGNILIRFKGISEMGGRGNIIDYISGGIIILVVLEASRRVSGKILPAIAVLMLLYGKLGYICTGYFKHTGFSIKRIIGHLTLSTEGIFGTMLGVSSTYIYLFILFGAFLEVSGASQVFNNMALALAGNHRGGPAKVAVLSSGLMGSVSGSASANVATTGVFTIPLMRKLGYKDYFAAAVEAAASTGGQIMPPVMGSAAFLMADTLGVNYSTVLKAALIPSMLFYFSIWVIVDLRSRKENISGLPKESLPSIKSVLKEGWHLILPLILLVIAICLGYSAKKAALFGIVSILFVSFLNKSSKMTPDKVLQAIVKGSLAALGVSMACAVIGNIIGIASLTGVIMNIGAVVLKLGGGKLWLTLILTMLSALVMGMGLPTTAVYVLTSTIAAPTLISLGVPALAAHLFVFYFGILAAITPPVCNASYTAAGISGANPNRTGFEALKLASAGFIIPFIFATNPALLLTEQIGIIYLLEIILSSVIGIFALGIAIEGFWKKELKWYGRIVCLLCSILLISPEKISDFVGIIIFTVLFFCTNRKVSTQTNRSKN